MLDSLDCVTLAVPDLDAAVRQYVRLLGRTPSWRGEQPAAGTHNSLFRLGNTVLELVAPAPGAVPELDSELSSDLNSEPSSDLAPVLGLAFGTDDVDALRAAWVARGVQASELRNELDRDVESGAFRKRRCVSLSLGASRGVSLSAVQCLSPDELLPLAATLEEEAGSVFALDHAVVQTREPDATKHLYGDILGLRLALERDFPQWKSRLQFFRVGNVTVEVAATLGDDASDESSDASSGGSVAAGAPRDRDRLWGLCWRVADAESAQQRMRRAGLDVSEVREGRKPGTRVFTVRSDTCGVPTLVLEPVLEPGSL